MGCANSDAKAARAFGRADLGCRTSGSGRSGGSAAVGRADMGRGSSARTTSGSRQLGSNRGATGTHLGRPRRSSTPGRTRSAVLGRYAARAGASGSRRGFGTGPSRTTPSRPCGTRTDLGIASRRGCGAGRSGYREPGPGAFVGRCTASCRPGRSSRDRLGRVRAKRPARDAAGALVE